MTNTALRDWRTCRVVESRTVTPRARRITLERPVPLGRPAAPGSHVDVRVRLGEGPLAATDIRSYSVVESDPTGTLLTLTVQLAEHSRGGSAHLHSLRVGDTVEATRPLQDFPLLAGADGYVLLAGGIGVTALVGAARALARLETDYRLVYVGRSRASMAYVDLLQAEHGPRLELHVDDEGTALDVEALVHEVAGAPGRRELLMCGPVRLMDAVRRAWQSADLSPVDLRFETFGNSGWYDAEPFEVCLPEQGVEAVVAPDQTMLEALSAAGADVMWDCRKGECGLCLMSVTDLTGRLDHRDVFLSDAQQQGGRQVCVCVARVVANAGAGPARVTLAFA
ncbi:MAG TPA: PDR/VanB family oxidoreductase [Nocardioides sp.]|jgi:vanillate O-demethylase ferredoxin subunit|uniref:PDR/VanB family oxidoreductase n=1 Tax=Nocardioides sp. TaxID=35761 RepID=UPI002E2F71B5|nr:PDR/VanB family oxidoreductase [Nocardioides sp.]HEX3930793.1 PDR/VanB family oxidoreductase [Nocardioides sp.]